MQLSVLIKTNCYSMIMFSLPTIGFIISINIYI